MIKMLTQIQSGEIYQQSAALGQTPKEALFGRRAGKAVKIVIDFKERKGKGERRERQTKERGKKVTVKSAIPCAEEMLGQKMAC